MGQVLIDACLDDIINVIRATQYLPKWYYKSFYAKKLPSFSDSQSLTYSVTDLPWPFSDRDSVVIATVTNQKNSDIRITLSGKPDAYPLQKNRIRVTKLAGF